MTTPPPDLYSPEDAPAGIRALHESLGSGAATEQILQQANRLVGELNAAMGIRLTEVSPERLVATMPVLGNRQPFGLLHGGANAVLAEALGSFHAAVLVGPHSMAVGIELNCSHHRSATSGTVTGQCIPIHVGRTMATFEIVITKENGDRVCTARLSCYLRPIG